jgi:hypothetical protein
LLTCNNKAMHDANMQLDDAYRVEVRYVDDERGHRRIAELRVRFIANA